MFSEPIFDKNNNIIGFVGFAICGSAETKNTKSEALAFLANYRKSPEENKQDYFVVLCVKFSWTTAVTGDSLLMLDRSSLFLFVRL